jgi:hypothetical protein
MTLCFVKPGEPFGTYAKPPGSFGTVAVCVMPSSATNAPSG